MREIFKDANFDCPIFCPTEATFSARFIIVSDAREGDRPAPARTAMNLTPSIIIWNHTGPRLSFSSNQPPNGPLWSNCINSNLTLFILSDTIFKLIVNPIFQLQSIQWKRVKITISAICLKYVQKSPSLGPTAECYVFMGIAPNSPATCCVKIV